MNVYLVKVWHGGTYLGSYEPMDAFIDKAEADKCAASYLRDGRDVFIQELPIMSKWEEE